MTLPNGMRLIVQNAEDHSRRSPCSGSVRNEPQLETAPGKDGVSDVLDDLFSYGTKNLDRLAFQKALDDIAADESAGFNFSLQVLKQDFSRGVQLLADNELNPALPERSLQCHQAADCAVRRRQNEKPGISRGTRAEHGLASGGRSGAAGNDPQTVSSLTLDDVKQYYAKTLRPDLDDHRGDRRRHAGRSQERDREMVWSMEGRRPQAGG